MLHKHLMKDISESVDSDDEIEIILIELIIAFSADFLDMKDHSQVQKIQLKLVLFLQADFPNVNIFWGADLDFAQTLHKLQPTNFR